MRLYEFNYCRGRLKKSAYDVKETKSLYVLEKGCFEYVYVSRINKGDIGKIKDDGWFGYTMFSDSDDIEPFLEKIAEKEKAKMQKMVDEMKKLNENIKVLSDRTFKIIDETKE